MEDIEFIKVELNNRQGYYRKLRFNSIEQLNRYIIEKYNLNNNKEKEC